LFPHVLILMFWYNFDWTLEYSRKNWFQKVCARKNNGIKLIIIFSSQLRYLFRSCLYTQIFKTNINLWSSTFQAFFPRRYLSIILLYLYNIMPNITYISCSVWLFCNTIAIHLLKKKNSCDHISLNTYKSLLRTGSMSRPKNKK
jgi:hypothetical protein